MDAISRCGRPAGHRHGRDELPVHETEIKGEESNYATIWRHIKKMHKNGLVSSSDSPRKDGTPDKRKTKMATLTFKGIATILIEGNIEEDELLTVAKKLFAEIFGENQLKFIEPILAGVYADAFLKMKPKVKDVTNTQYTRIVNLRKLGFTPKQVVTIMKLKKRKV